MSRSSGKTEIIARGIIRHREFILLCKNVAGGYYYLPGGHVEFGEAAAPAVEREVLEETGLASRASDLVLVTEERFEARGRVHHELNLVFLVELDGLAGALPDVRSREESIAFEWIRRARLPEIDLRPASIKAWLAADDDRSAGRGRPDWISTI